MGRHFGFFRFWVTLWVTNYPDPPPFGSRHAPPPVQPEVELLTPSRALFA